MNGILDVDFVLADVSLTVQIVNKWFQLLYSLQKSIHILVNIV